MSDIEKSADELSRKAAFAAAKDAAQRAVENALLTDEERAAKKQQEAEATRAKRKKWLALGIVGLLLVLGLVGLVVSYWQWFLLADFVGLLGLYARYRFKKYWAARKQPKTKAAEIEPEADEEPAKRVNQPAKRVELPAKPVRVEPPPIEIDQSEIDDELAALKARVKK